MNIKIALIELGKRQVDLIPQLEKRGLKILPCDISTALNENRFYNQPKMVKIRAAITEIIDEWRREKNENDL